MLCLRHTQRDATMPSPCDALPKRHDAPRCLAETKSHSTPHCRYQTDATPPCHDNAMQYLHPRCIVPCRHRASRFLTAPLPHKTLPKLRHVVPCQNEIMRDFALTLRRQTLPLRDHTSPKPHFTLPVLRPTVPYLHFTALYATWPPRRVGGHGCDGLKTTQCRMQATCGAG